MRGLKYGVIMIGLAGVVLPAWGQALPLVSAGTGVQDTASQDNEQPADREITQLIDRVELQVADGRVWSPPGDNALETVRRILDLVPQAGEATIAEVNAMPQRLRDRAAIETATGHSVEARRFTIFADALSPGSNPPPLAPRVTATPADRSPPQEETRSPGVTQAEASTGMATDASGPGIAAPARAAELATVSPPVPAPMAVPTVAPASRPAPEPETRQALTGKPGTSVPGMPALQPLAPEVMAALMRRGDEMLAIGDISAARLLYERAALGGSGAAATAAGRTHDPDVLAGLGTRGIRPDPEAAMTWYRRAASLGDPEAMKRLKRLEASGTR
ncbi:SEL1-like repeat protein [Rhodovastum atsumiense]|uniref:SEL1-like repeat protein n=1 Tax=Rhodovastum atsumiense TaxID=504468 RepID=A0A5M6IT97_9PROT|nr:sel1 repeat family protein [Rhodovastum atsumiense]KAA5610778.1 SEL1-like repeat protein [Rhodovastum atsumiense]CAH2604447.1 SEL1-like repeat protein [Rhodovastum atsumiense]